MINKPHHASLFLKTVIIFSVLAFGIAPLLEDHVGKISLYNYIVPGRQRFPYSDNPAQSYNMSLFNLDANLASHALADNKKLTGEVRVFVLGDSSTWGTLLRPEETLTGQLNQLGMQTQDGKDIRFYNLGYPTLSLTKDLLLLEKAIPYQPDLVIWLFTLESFPLDKQLSSPIVANNSEAVRGLIGKYQLNLDPHDGALKVESFWNRTLFGQRRNLADIFRLQLYGVMWGITGIDQYYPPEYEKAARDLTADTSYHDWQEGEMTEADLALDLLDAGHEIAGQMPLLLINEPILISAGTNSDLRYNFYYPIWAYDRYRQLLDEHIDPEWHYLDLWNLIPEQEFTNTAIHVTPEGIRLMRDEIADIIQLMVR
jgi:hypothetical protein